MCAGAYAYACACIKHVRVSCVHKYIYEEKT